jgi:hypothetical protein
VTLLNASLVYCQSKNRQKLESSIVSRISQGDEVAPGQLGQCKKNNRESRMCSIVLKTSQNDEGFPSQLPTMQEKDPPLSFVYFETFSRFSH